ncbi:MAG TPA: mechanosensitive ion channel protein MscS, partial [Microbacterium sp.]|nr:mechanosensitive ion channel protein MscS [Microbacterium sp.]
IDFAQDTTEQVLETDLWTAVQAWLLEAGTRLLAVAAIVAVA